MSELRRLQTFVDLARLGTIAAVASASAYSTSAVSQQIATLERDFGVALVEPDGRRLRLTAAGRALAGLAPELLGDWESARSVVAASQGQTSGTVTLAAFQTAFLAIVPAVLAELRSTAPLVRLRCVQAEPDVSVPGLLAREHDVAIIERYAGQAPVSSPDLRETPVGQDPMLVAVPTGCPGTTLDDFADTPWTMEPPGSPVHAWALATCREAGFQPRIAHDTPDVVVQCALAAAGHAAAFIPALTPPALRGPVRLVPLPAAQARTLSVATRRSRAADPAIRAVTAAIRTAAGGLLEGVPA